jgi:hypothetical protein
MFGQENAPCSFDDDLLQMIDHLHIPAIKVTLLAEYNRVKGVFEPLIKEYEEKKSDRVP